MQDLAADYLEHFSLEFGETTIISLADTAPEDLRELGRLIGDLYGPDRLASLYEALSVAADSELPHCAEVDEKVCPLDLYFIVLDFLGARAIPRGGM